MTEATGAAADVADLSGELVLHGRVLPASNATFLGTIDSVTVAYKPVAGERPLWDFPEGTLAGREVAAYLVSEATRWDLVPRTWLRDGPHGVGMVQVWQEPVEGVGAIDVVPAGAVPEGWLHVFDGVGADDDEVSLIHEDSVELRRMAVFDVLVNNADRKGGHVLAMPSGHRYGVDHGVSFHVEPKLRTVLWGWAGQPLSEDELAAVRRLRELVDGPLRGSLREHLTGAEVDAFAERCEALLADGSMPEPGGHWPVIPWPPF
jgi:uncharacterized repeat protein (TIGR03843 family)